ncbi:MAG: hypothetical protein RLZZ133_1227 [Pseudomonadota bacterium]|jgi:hypothetical protein
MDNRFNTDTDRMNNINAGHVPGIGYPIKFSNHTRLIESSAPPMPSKHAFDSLTEFSFSKADVDARIAQGAVASPGLDQ